MIAANPTRKRSLRSRLDRFQSSRQHLQDISTVLNSLILKEPRMPQATMSLLDSLIILRLEGLNPVAPNEDLRRDVWCNWISRRSASTFAALSPTLCCPI